MNVKPDCEKFLVTFTLKNGGVVDGLCVFGNRLVASELSHKLIYFLTSSKIRTDEDFKLQKNITFSQREMEIITYIGGAAVGEI